MSPKIPSVYDFFKRPQKDMSLDPSSFKNPKKTKLLISFIPDKNGHNHSILINEKKVGIKDLPILNKYHQIITKYIHWSCDVKNLDVNEVLKENLTKADQDYPEFKRTRGRMIIANEQAPEGEVF